ncbi:MAG: class I SAM-dependent methyltransferase [Magnetococcales bacterium]|nr:class I SAM-dependent methyltransferase [Magnetococcales bacterium]
MAEDNNQTTRRQHWETVYQTKPVEQLSWFQKDAGMSLRFVRQAQLPDKAHIVDVGGGTSVLAGVLLRENATWSISVLDISAASLHHARASLGDLAHRVQWVEADVTQWRPDFAADLWHDRAMFHFLVAEGDRKAYADTLRTVLRPGGHAIIATFSLHGPTQCSHLPIVRYDASTLLAAIGDGLTLRDQCVMQHQTPSGKVQEFQFCLMQRV